MKITDFNPVFIVGTSRSGTTMLNRILGNNSQIYNMNELHFFGDLWDPYTDKYHIGKQKAVEISSILLSRIHQPFWDAKPTADDRNQAEEVVSEISIDSLSPPIVFQKTLLHELNNAKKRFIVEQTPKNIFYISKLLEFFPNSKFLHLIRDPRAVLFSQKNRWRRRWLGSKAPLFEMARVFINYHPYTVAKVWKKTVEISYHFKDHPQYKRVFFEHLLETPEIEVRSICRFLGISFESKMLDIPQVGSSVREDSSNKKGVSAEVAYRWKGRLSKGDVAFCEMLLGQMMKELHYDPVNKKIRIIDMIGPVLKFPLHVIGVLMINPKLAFHQLRAILEN